jgi:hypothetical protein
MSFDCGLLRSNHIPRDQKYLGELHEAESDRRGKPDAESAIQSFLAASLKKNHTSQRMIYIVGQASRNPAEEKTQNLADVSFYLLKGAQSKSISKKGAASVATNLFHELSNNKDIPERIQQSIAGNVSQLLSVYSMGAAEITPEAHDYFVDKKNAAVQREMSPQLTEIPIG